LIFAFLLAGSLSLLLTGTDHLSAGLTDSDTGFSSELWFFASKRTSDLHACLFLINTLIKLMERYYPSSPPGVMYLLQPWQL